MPRHHADLLHCSSEYRSGFERVLVDPAQTSFWEGREFRTFLELNIAAGATQVIRVIATQNLVLMKLSLVIESGGVRMGTYIGGTPGGTFGTTMPVLPCNAMSAGQDHRVYTPPSTVYAATTLVATGGTHTGGVELDVLRVKTNANQQQAISVGAVPFDERGVGPATYYFRLLASAGDAVIGVVSSRWEERLN